jgi:protein O-mannosyl-transferase
MKARRASKSHAESVRTPRSPVLDGAQPVWPARSLWLGCLAATAIVLYIAFEVYGPALHGPFVFDDFNLPFYNPLFRTEQFLAWINGVRPFLMFSYWINYQLSGRDPYSYHVLNLLLHIANSAAVYLIARRILSREVQDSSRREIVAVFAAMLFLLHPIQTESVAWVAGRSETLSAMFFLCAFVIFLYRPSEAIAWGRSVWVLVLFACAVASKEHTASLPIVLLLTDLFWAREEPLAAVRKNWRLYIPMVCVAVVALGFVWRVVGASKSAGFAGTGSGWLSYALTQCRVLFVYLRLFLFPVNQNLDYDMPWSPVRFEIWSFAGLLGLAALVILAWRSRRRFPVGSYGFLLFLVLIAPTSSFIPIADPIAEHRLYLPMIGLVLVACEVLLHSIQQRTWAVAVAGAILVIASVATYERNRLWGSEVALWEDTVAKSPNKLRGYVHLVHGLVNQHHCREAIQRLDVLSKRRSLDPALLGHWAIAYECVNEPEHALQKLELAAAQSPSGYTYVEIAKNQLSLERETDAIQSLSEALKLDPGVESAYVLRGEINQRHGNLATAVRDYQRALVLNPGDQRAQFLLRQVSE